MGKSEWFKRVFISTFSLSRSFSSPFSPTSVVMLLKWPLTDECDGRTVLYNDEVKVGAIKEIYLQI